VQFPFPPVQFVARDQNRRAMAGARVLALDHEGEHNSTEAIALGEWILKHATSHFFFGWLVCRPGTKYVVLPVYTLVSSLLRTSAVQKRSTPTIARSRLSAREATQQRRWAHTLGQVALLL